MDLESGGYTEDPVRVAVVRSVGAWCWVCLGLVGFFLLMVLWTPVQGVTDVPQYAKSILFMSLSHHFDEVQVALGSVSPPPPSFLR